ncbi:EscJ/YscJ/HrcJ family type III secretion inner membrane ring protein [Sphingomonas lenta]|uniref:Lipoprotein n=2 Tax=Sphingomonas lenta TaxID=1141887 RepID=A0A2A2SDR5_9SPHN|nr:EscJ/YscJ/HrcJ family type III secretion inner membrane ring protein [Sphingomonas lenta]
MQASACLFEECEGEDVVTRAAGATKRRRRRAGPVLVGLALLLAACGQAELYTKLSEAQANEMIAVLQSAGISATKENGGEAGWTLVTDKGSFARAVEVLHSRGYPREEFADLCTVFKKEGFVSSPTEERARLVCGLSQELSRTISEIDGVVQARVHLALPQAQPLAETTQPASASVFIKYRPGANIDAQVGKVKSLVVNSVEGLSYDKVSVETFPAQPLPTAAAAGPAGALSGGLPALLAVALLGLLGLFAYPSFRRWNQRRAIVRRGTGA